MQVSGYSHKEIQTWVITNGRPTAQGAMQIYPGAWSVSGQGTTQRAQGSQALAAQWNSNVAPMNAPLAVFVRASDNRLIIKPWHSQLRAPGSTAVSKQAGLPGAAPSNSTVQSDAYEWPFPTVEDVSTSTNVSGSGAIAIAGTYLPMLPPGTAGASATATCNWQFRKGVERLLPAEPATRTPTVPLGGSSPSKGSTKE